VQFLKSTMNQMNAQISATPGIGLLQLKTGPAAGNKAVQNMIIGSNMIGVLAVLALLAKAAGSGDDDKDEWVMDIEGGWSDLDANEIGILLGAKRDRYTVTLTNKRTGQVKAFNYTQWPIFNVMATAGAIRDSYKYRGAKKSAGDILIAAVGNMAFGFMEQSQMQGLARLFGEDRYKTDATLDTMKMKAAKAGAGIVGMTVPNFVRDIDITMSPEKREAVTAWDVFKNQIPGFRETLPKQLDDLGKPIILNRSPLKRVVKSATASQAELIRGQLADVGIVFDGVAKDERQVWENGVKVPLEKHGPKRDAFILNYGEALEHYIITSGPELLQKAAAARALPVEERGKRMDELKKLNSKKLTVLRTQSLHK
jgi:hypothetical protein